jgi:UDP-N-acetylmuramate-alanine ligase
LTEQVRDGDVVIAMGAGSIGSVAQKLKDQLEGAR